MWLSDGQSALPCSWAGLGLTLFRRNWCGPYDVWCSLYVAGRNALLRRRSASFGKRAPEIYSPASLLTITIDPFRLRFNSHHWTSENGLFLCSKAENTRHRLLPRWNHPRLPQVAILWSYTGDIRIFKSVWVRRVTSPLP